MGGWRGRRGRIINGFEKSLEIYAPVLKVVILILLLGGDGIGDSLMVDCLAFFLFIWRGREAGGWDGGFEREGGR